MRNHVCHADILQTSKQLSYVSLVLHGVNSILWYASGYTPQETPSYGVRWPLKILDFCHIGVVSRDDQVVEVYRSI